MPGRVIVTVGVGARMVRNVTFEEDIVADDVAEMLLVTDVMDTR